MARVHTIRRTHETKGTWLASLRDDGAAFRAAAAQAGLGAAIPSCPGWTAGDLVHHLGSLYRHTGSHVGRGVTTPPERTRADFESEPRAGNLLAWWGEQFDALMNRFDALDPDTPAWNRAPQRKRVAYWMRRMAHETAVHRWDAQTATGSVKPIEAKLAADGVAEVLDTWLPAGRRLFPPTAERPAVGRLVLHATDVDHAWHVRLRGEGIALLDTETVFGDVEPPPRVVANGSASDIELALYGRVGFDVLDIVGDERLLRALRVG